MRPLLRCVCSTGLASLLTSCGLLPGDSDARSYPLLIEEAAVFGANALPVDLDGDSRDEIVAHHRPPVHPARPALEAMMVFDAANRPIIQVNYSARLLAPDAIDLDGDGRSEILVPFVRDDSLFISAVDAQGQHRFTFFLADGKPRVEPTGILPWDPVVIGVRVQDVDGDERPELVSIVNTPYARAPRGVYINRLPTGQPLGRLLIGAAIGRAEVADLDGDGTEELVLECASANNGASAGGFDDARAYAIVVKLGIQPTIEFSRDLGARSYIKVIVQRGPAAARPRLVIVSSRVPPDDAVTEIEAVDPATWATTERLSRSSHFRMASVGEFDASAGEEIAVVSVQGEWLLLGSDLRELGRGRMGMQGPGSIITVPDIDDDGFDDIVAVRPDRWLLLGATGRTKGLLPAGPYERFVDGTLRRRRTDGVGGAQLLVRSRDGLATHALRVVTNRWHLAYRYGPTAGAAMLAVGLSSLGVMLGGLYRRNRRLRSVQVLALDSAPSGFFLLDRAGRVEWMNATLRSWLSAQPGPASAGRFEVLFSPASDLSGFCRELLSSDVVRQRERLGQLDTRDQPLAARFIAVPVTQGGTRPDWLVRIVDAADDSSDGEWRTWALLAQRVAHDLKNPLTSMLLTLQRMRVEYRKRAPDASDALDEYSRRIEDRIGHLRRMTANFMKLTRADDPDRRPVRLAVFLESLRATLLAGLPPDIDLRIVAPTDTGATMLVDPDQLTSVLENLVANSVNALPDGGAITITAGIVRRVQLRGNLAGDFVQFDVVDTGVGIPHDLLQRIFDPGFSTSPHGSGLGLPIVRKIVSDHGGDVAIESHPGSGTVVSVYLPLIDESTASSGQAADGPSNADT
jgi:nitrogen-specific signal transduction histidine kinase